MTEKALKIMVLAAILLLQNVRSKGQTVGDYALDDPRLYSMNKQVNQFIRRFNAEEDKAGEKLYPGDEGYHNRDYRRQSLPLMFDQENKRTSSKLTSFFIEDVTDENQACYLNFTDSLWYAEASCKFEYEDTTVDLILFLSLEQSGEGYKWILTQVYFEEYHKRFPGIGSIFENNHFLHPMSHELDFMNLEKAFRDSQHIEYYASDDYRPDYLVLFFDDVKNGVLNFLSVSEVKFHFFQIPGWYFELSYLNRASHNSGWLITNLMFLKQEEKQQLIEFYNP